MGSVLLSTVGTAVGGPLAGAVAASAGAALDSALFGRARRQAPPEFRAPTSAYGDLVPAAYGRARLSGVLVWATPFRRAVRAKGGTSDRAAYTASFAVALSSRPIEAVGRIWADGRLIRDAGGAFAFDVTMRVHRGTPGQPVDPLIAAAEGMDACPAYRRLAYVVFEDFPLAHFGNRIPALSFEVVADPEGVAPAAWVEEQFREAGLADVTCAAAEPLEGYVGLGRSVREDVVALGEVLGIRPSSAASPVRLATVGRSWTVPRGELGARGAGSAEARAVVSSANADAPGACIVTYLDPDRDYQLGSQRYGTGASDRALELSAAVVANAGDALAVAKRRLADAAAARERLEIALSWDWLEIAPNDVVVLEGDGRTWRVVETRIEPGVVRLRCEAVPGGQVAGHATDPGRVLPAPVERSVPTRLAMAELPGAIAPGGGPALNVCALAEGGWAGAAIGWAFGGDDGFLPLGTLRAGVPHGELLEPLPEGPAEIWDESLSVVLACHGGAELLQSRARLAVLNGANLLRIGDEVIQYRTVQSEGADRFRLRGLLRGRLLTRAAAHAVGTFWHGLPPAALLALRLEPAWTGRELLLEASGAGDPAGGTLATHLLTGAGSAPLAPCHLRLAPEEGGGLRLRWIARDRGNLDWAGQASPEARAYRVRLDWEGSGFPQPLTLLATGDSVAIPASVVAEIRARGLREVGCEIVAEGDGPLALRSTGWRTVRI